MKEWGTSHDEKRDWPVSLEFGAWLIVVLFALGVGLFALASAAAAQRTIEIPNTGTVSSFPICEGSRRVTCVVDGDTFWLDGEKIRIADIDAPEVSQPQCANEAELGDRATYRLAELLAAGTIELRRSGADRDRYGRLLRVVIINGESVGSQLIREGYARHWPDGPEFWC